MKTIFGIRVLDCMKNHCDGSHWGLSDWYPEIEAGIREALALGINETWTTEWYSSKKEIASACITKMDSPYIVVEASVSDDLDTEGYGKEQIFISATKHNWKMKPVDEVIDLIKDAIGKAWDGAEEDRKNNEVYVGFSIHNDKGHWIETYLLDKEELGGEPPGDNYHQWGWQEESEIPDDVKEVLEEWIYSYTGSGEFAYGGYTIRTWEN